MKTGMLSWTKLNPIVKIVPVKKMFHGQYLNKIVIYCPAARTILVDNESDLKSVLQRRISDRLIYNWGGSWSNINQSEILQKDSDYNQLKYYHFLKKTSNLKKISFRIEEPNITIYGNNELDLYNIVAESLLPNRLLEVHRPISSEAESLLLKGEIISSTNSDYNFKIYLRSYRFDNADQKKVIAEKLENNKEDFKVPNKIKNFLQSENLFFTGGYLYCKDAQTITFVRLVMPELVSSIFKLGQLTS